MSVRRIVSLLLLTALSAPASVSPSQSAALPRAITPPTQTVAGLERELPYLTLAEPEPVLGSYHSEHFTFRYTGSLDESLLEEIAQLCEATRFAVQELPLDITYPVPTSAFEIHLFQTEPSYLDAGGIQGTAGIYLPSEARTLIRLDLLTQAPKGEPAPLNHRRAKTLVHEVTHQLQHQWMGKVPIWLLEGIAVYMESIPISEEGKFLFESIHFRQSESVSRCTTNRLSVTNLEHLMGMSGHEWIEHFQANPLSVHRNYLSAYLLTYYFLHLEGEGDASTLCQYIRKMEKASNKQAYEKADQLLLNGKSMDELEADLIAAYQNEGMTLVPINGHLLSYHKAL
ncbi:MAG: hypothetical protein AAGC73_00485 [Verrucomicrobiota bacterium]